MLLDDLGLGFSVYQGEWWRVIVILVSWTGLGDQQKQLQKQCVGIIQGNVVLGTVTGANTCPAESYGSPTAC